MSAPDIKKNKELISTVLEHYLKHHELVLKKLITVQKATQMSLEKIQLLSEATNADEFDTIWDETIEMFRDCGISEDELFQIEDILNNIPKAIKENYQKMVDKDQSIQDLTKELDRDKYEQAMQSIKAAQDEPNPMTGLGPEEYEEDHGIKETPIKTVEIEDPSREWWKPDEG